MLLCSMQLCVLPGGTGVIVQPLTRSSCVAVVLVTCVQCVRAARIGHGRC